ncbi:hypothetical protein TNCT_226061 [Trichonephila clavata]|uniref:Uncharacterized protein n=1 Tax=Trichonephila clavata TaxID=2740835 RepID=A0A8X6JAH8_TRICU|nr:hypothetical protein TNCT_226061 [Trichonephila clavata]
MVFHLKASILILYLCEDCLFGNLKVSRWESRPFRGSFGHDRKDLTQRFPWFSDDHLIWNDYDNDKVNLQNTGPFTLNHSDAEIPGHIQYPAN